MRVRSFHRVAFVVAAIAAPILASPAVADSPILDGGDRIDSRNGRFFAVPSKGGKETIVYEKVKPKREVWRMAGRHEFADLSDDGEYIVDTYAGSNLIPLDYKPDLTMLTFYNRGVLVRKVPLSELIKDFRSLRRSISHYDWGFFLGFSAPHLYNVRTIEDRLIRYDVTTGQAVSNEPLTPRNTFPPK